MLRRKQERLPVRTDFGRGLDEAEAWKNFGELSLDQAYSKFCEHPEYYQEDFMFMGWKAFQFYFPVVDRYLHEVVVSDASVDCEAWILGCACETQLAENEPWGGQLLTQVAGLADYVLVDFSTKLEGRDQKRVRKQWNKVAGLCRKLLD